MIPEENIGKRFEVLKVKFNLNNSTFGDMIGTSDTVIRYIITNRNKPSFDILKKILHTFENINAEWLLLGTGEMLKNKENLSVVTEPREDYSLKTNNEMEKKLFLDLVERNLKLQNEIDRLKDELEYYRTGNSSKAKF